MLGMEKSSPHTPLPLQRDVRTGLTLCLHFPAVVSGPHRLGGSTYEPCWFRSPVAEVKVSADVASHEGCGESLYYLFPLTFRALLAMVSMPGLGELCLPLHLSSPVSLSVSNCVLCMGTAILLEEGPS